MFSGEFISLLKESVGEKRAAAVLEALGEKIEDKLTERLSPNERAALIILLQKMIGIDQE